MYIFFKLHIFIICLIIVFYILNNYTTAAFFSIAPSTSHFLLLKSNASNFLFKRCTSSLVNELVHQYVGDVVRKDPVADDRRTQEEEETDIVPVQKASKENHHDNGRHLL